MSKEQTETAGRAIGLLGASIRFPVTEPGYAVAELTAEPGFAPTPHVHRVHHEIFCVVEGSFDFLVGDDTMRVDAGGVVDVPPGLVHDFYNPGPSPARLLGVVMPGEINGYFERIEEHILAGTFDADAFEQLRGDYDTESVHLVWRSSASDGG